MCFSCGAKFRTPQGRGRVSVSAGMQTDGAQGGAEGGAERPFADAMAAIRRMTNTSRDSAFAFGFATAPSMDDLDLRRLQEQVEDTDTTDTRRRSLSARP